MSSWINYNNSSGTYSGYSFSYKFTGNAKVDPQKTNNERMKHKLVSYGPFDDPPKKTQYPMWV